MLVSVGPFVPRSQQAPFGGRTVSPVCAFCAQRGSGSACGVPACRVPVFVLRCFASLNSCLSETWSLGPGSTGVAMATGASILPSVWNPQADRWEGSHPGIIST